MPPRILEPTPAEIASSWLLGEVEGLPGLPAAARGDEPVAVLEELALSALAAGRCFVAFSGGLDSSAVLAVAARAARREGLPLPIPVTARVADVPGMDESAWQELVVARLRLPDWERFEVGEELDLVGDVCGPILRRHGLLFPPTFAMLAVLGERARGGTLLTGVGGHSIFGGWRFAPLGSALRGRRARGGRAALAAGHAALPRAARERVLRRRGPAAPWLRPAARRAIAAAWAAVEAGEPVAWSRYLEWRRRLRRTAATSEATRLVGEHLGVPIVNPLEDGRFLAALRAHGGRAGLGDRNAAMAALFSGLLPGSLLARRDKAGGSQAFFRAPSLAAAAAWDGAGVDLDLVDPDALRAAWLAPRSDLRSALALQAAWLATGSPAGHAPR